MTNGYDGGAGGKPPGMDPAPDIRAEMQRSVAGVRPAGDLVAAVHQRARMRRRRRRLAAGVAVTASATAVLSVGTILPILASRHDQPAAGPVAAPATADTPPWPSAGSSPAAGASSVDAPPAGRPPSDSPGVASPWGPATLDDSFVRPELDRSRWSVYDGPADSLGRWSAAEVAVRDGALRLSVSRPGGDPASRWGGIGALSSAQRYGRWEVRVRMTVGRGVIGQFVLSPVPGTAADPSAVIVVSVSPYQRVLSVSGTGTGRAGMRVAALSRPGDYHVVAVEWTPVHVRVLLDGAMLFEWADGRLPVPLWPALQTIMAGPDCGSVPLPADCQGTTTSFPQRFDVDWIRARSYRG